MSDQLVIAGKPYASRLLVGTGKYKDFAETRAAIDASGAQIVTVAIRRTNIGQNPGEPNLLDSLPPSQFTLLPNTAGCYTAIDAVRTLRLARELLDGHDLVKLEVLGDVEGETILKAGTTAAADEHAQLQAGVAFFLDQPLHLVGRAVGKQHRVLHFHFGYLHFSYCVH